MVLVEDIQKLRTEQIDKGVDNVNLIDQIIEKERVLKEIQGEQPLVYERVGEDVVAAIVADWTGIPVGKMVGDEIQNILTLDSKLSARVMKSRHLR